MNPFAIFIAACACSLACSRPADDALVVEANSPAIGSDGKLVESIGLETLGEQFTPLLETGVSVPCEVSRVFSTAADNQARFMITLYRGHSDSVRDAHLLGRFQVSGYPLAPRGQPQVDVRLGARERMVVLTAQDKITKQRYHLERVQ
jgi:molecular chaperone DnaK (HSP70)